ncbi:MAG: hypothetical protein ACI4JS_07375 [Oscillospiraceae bacterium]
MSFLHSLLMQMERSTAGSDQTTRDVMRACGNVSGGKALFFGDDYFTPKHISEVTKAEVTAAYYEDFRAEKAAESGLTVQHVGAYQILENNGGWDFIWFNGSTEPDGVERRLEQLKLAMKPKSKAVYRTLCWLIDPSPDTRCYMEHRFGYPEHLDGVIRKAKDQGFKVLDFVISPRSDWTHGFYEPMDELMKALAGEDDSADSDVQSGIGELNKEMYMFNLHSEEYSFVYYILEK